MKGSSHAVAVGATIAALGFASTGACTSGKSADDTASIDAAAATDARPRRTADSSDFSEPPQGGGGPLGWELYTDYDPACGIYVPSDAKYLPEPIRWESCSLMDKGHGLPGPDGMDCRKMVLDRDGGEPDQLSGTKRAEVVAGNVRLLIRRTIGGRAYRMVADLDGPVHQALLLTGGCALGGFRMGGGNVMYRVYDTDATSSHWPGGAIGGPVESLRPRTYIPRGHLPSKVFSQEYEVGANYFIEAIGSGADKVYSMVSGSPVGSIDRAPEDSGMLYAGYRFHGDDVFWMGDNGLRTAIKVWTLSQGVNTLVGWPGDDTRAAGGIGVDGVDMIWVEARGRKGYSFESYELWTAKYTTDPGVLASTKRYLFANKLGSTLEEHVVGCGYAAVAIHPKREWGQGAGFLVIRLSDGMSWTVETESMEQRRDFEFREPLAITCDEIIVSASTMNAPQLARIRLDSLGPGTRAE